MSDITFKWYCKLYDICESDFTSAASAYGDVPSAIICAFWSIQRTLRFVVKKILSFELAVSILASLGFAGFTIISIRNTISTSFGIGIFQYLGLFDTLESVFTVLFFLVFLSGVVKVLISIGQELSGFGNMLDMYWAVGDPGLLFGDNQPAALEDHDK
jgi:hypothetical protein